MKKPRSSAFTKRRIARSELLEEKIALSANSFPTTSPVDPNDYSIVAEMVPPSQANEVFEISDVSDEFCHPSSASSPAASSNISNSPSTSSAPSSTVIDTDVFAIYSSEEIFDFDVTSIAASARSGSGGNFSGGLGTISPTYSGGGIEYQGGWLVTEGSSILISISGGMQGDTVRANVVHGATDDTDVSITVGQATIGNSPFLEVTINSDAQWGEGDENFTISLEITNGFSTLSRSSFNFVIVENPEFISDGDYNSENDSINRIPNDDYYRAYVQKNAQAGTAITTLNSIGVTSTANVRYEIAQQEDDWWSAPSQYFQINSQTGELLLNSDASVFIEQIATYSWQLTIRVYRDDYHNLSGGDVFCDEATVNITFSNWIINRSSSSETCVAYPTDGCTIADLAHEIGLNADEFENWLTIRNAENGILLFGNNEPISVNNLSSDSILAETYWGCYTIPNVIYAAYCFDPSLKNPENEDQSNSANSFHWDYNISRLQNLGFKVIQFNNSDYSSDYEARHTFLCDIQNYSENKQLHGLYLVGHGSGLNEDNGNNNNVIGSRFSVAPEESHRFSWNSSWGPKWTVWYNDSNNPGLSIRHRLSYGLGALVLHSCYSSNRFTKSLLSSEPSNNNADDVVVFLGFTDITSPGWFDIASLWNQNKQRTNGFNEQDRQ